MVRSSSPTLFVTGATGQLGGLVIDALLASTPPSSIVAGVRDPDGSGAKTLRDKGVELRVADYARPETLAHSFAGVDRLLLISSSENGRRKEQHRNVVDAAKRASVGLVAYTSILHADRSPLLLAEEHRDTEAALRDSGLPFTFLRNGWYNEVYTWRMPLALRLGVLMGAAGDGRISSAARADYAQAAATVMTGDDHAGRAYELAGSVSFTLTDLASIVAAASRDSMTYRDMAPAAFRAALIEAGTPAPVARILSDTDAGVAKGALFEEGGDLSRLLGRPTTPIAETMTRYLDAPSERGEAEAG